MTTGSAERLPVLRTLCVLLILHFVCLIAFRLVMDADDFTNWDLISFLNANSSDSLGELLRQSQIHFRRPFSFPAYQTGAESVLASVIHHFMAGVSLYWSNTVVLAAVDLVFVAALGALFRLVFADLYTECLVWMLVAMSPVLLTFPAISAFNMQAFAAITLALLGSELVLQSRRRSGLVLVAVAFLSISQAYGLTFFLPLFCLVWTVCRSVHLTADGRGAGVAANAAILLATVAVLVAAVQSGSDGAYFDRVFRTTQGSFGEHSIAASPGLLLERMGELVREAFVPARNRAATVGFAPRFLVLVLGVAAVFAASVRPDLREGAPARSRIPIVGLAWVALVLFGYLPALNGHLKSQRCYFGDLFLAMALANAAAHLVRSRGLSPAKVLASLLALAVLSDGFYVSAVAGVNHNRVHMPVFDYDTADSDVRHDLDHAIELMRAETSGRKTGIIVYYPRGATENRTDPAMFHARFLRHFGPWRGRDDVIFPCHICSQEYGCPFPRADPGCGTSCCYHNPADTIAGTPSVAYYKFQLWWFSDPGVPDEPRQSRMLGSLRRSYRITDAGSPVEGWHRFDLMPRLARPHPPVRN